MASHPVLLLAGLICLATGGATVLRTRPVLRFRATGTVEPGSIPQWEVTVWKAIGLVFAGMGVLMLYIGGTAG